MSWVLDRTANADASLPDLPNPIARVYSVAVADLPIDEWEFVVSIAGRIGPGAGQHQFELWRRTYPEAKADALAAVWTAAQMSFELVVLGAITRNQADSARQGDRSSFDRWAAILEWIDQGGSGIVNQAAGHLATRPYSSRRTLESAMLPVSEVLQFAEYGPPGLQLLSD